MNHEQTPQPAQQKISELFGLTENEELFTRVSEKRFDEIFQDSQTIIHKAKISSNSFGEFLFISMSRPVEKGRAGITFYGLGYHEYRERLIDDEWFWYPTMIDDEEMDVSLDKEEVNEIINERTKSIDSDGPVTCQGNMGALFELLADLTDEDGALAELEDLEFLSLGFPDDPELEQIRDGQRLMDENIRQVLPELYSQEKLGLEAMAQVKYFTPDSNWTWYASEYDGDDTFFGLVSGLEVELGYFTLSELEKSCGPNGCPIERDLFFEPKTLRELMDLHRKNRNQNA